MTMRKAASRPIIIGGISAALIVSIIIAYSQLQIESEMTSIDKNTMNLDKALADRTQVRMQDAINTLEITSKLPQVQATAYANQISITNKGIPSNLDLEKGR